MAPAKCIRRLVVALVALAASPHGIAQELWPGMEKYLTVQTSPPALINHYSAPLVAVYWKYPCASSHEPISGHSDALLTYANPAQPGGQFLIGGAAEACANHISAVVWADGTEMGDPATLSLLHECRTVTSEEVHRTLVEDVLLVPEDKWNAEASVARLKLRHAPFEGTVQLGPNDSGNAFDCRGAAISAITQEIENYRSMVANHPDQLIQRRGLLLQFLKEWDQALTSKTYPEKRTRWDRPY